MSKRMENSKRKEKDLMLTRKGVREWRTQREKRKIKC